MGFRAAAGLLVLAMTAALSGCFGGGRGIVQDDPSAEAVSGASREEAETVLRGIVEKHLRAEAGRGSAAGPDMVRRRPYYFREYVEYPSGAGGMEIVLRDNDSRIRPLSGEVRVAKVRHSTRMHRSRGEAAEDANFFRDTGTEMLNYELRNGRCCRRAACCVTGLANRVWTCAPGAKPACRGSRTPAAAAPCRCPWGTVSRSAAASACANRSLSTRPGRRSATTRRWRGCCRGSSSTPIWQPAPRWRG